MFYWFSVIRFSKTFILHTYSTLFLHFTTQLHPLPPHIKNVHSLPPPPGQASPLKTELPPPSIHVVISLFFFHLLNKSLIH